MGVVDNPFFSFGMFMVFLAVAIAFPDISLEFISYSENIDPFVEDLFKTGMAFIATAFLTLPLWSDAL